MRTLRKLFVLLLLPLGNAAAQSVAVSGEPTSLVIATAVPGWPPDAATDGATSYSLTDVTAGSRLRARLLGALPAGVVVEVLAEAPPGAESAGWVTLDGSSRSLVLGLPAGNHGPRAIMYRLTVTVSVAPAFRDFTVLFEVEP